jgi:hypothetical protein
LEHTKFRDFFKYWPGLHSSFEAERPQHSRTPPNAP